MLDRDGWSDICGTKSLARGTLQGSTPSWRPLGPLDSIWLEFINQSTLRQGKFSLSTSALYDTRNNWIQISVDEGSPRSKWVHKQIFHGSGNAGLILESLRDFPDATDEKATG